MSDPVLLRQLSEDRALASAMLFPHRHTQDTPPFHIQMIDLWQSAEEYVVIEAFREGAKTTLAEEFLLTEGLFGNFGYLIIIGETYTKACQRIEAMKHELLSNSRIISLFGKQKGAIWSENKIVLPNTVAIEAHGWEEEHRGYKHLDRRPDRAYLDDIETKERVRDSKTVDQNWKKLHMQLLPAMDTVKGKVWMTGTPLADDCMLRRAAASEHWVYGKFPILQDDGRAAWPSRYPVEWVKDKEAHYAAEGLLGEFNQEYMLIATGAQGKPFTDEHITVSQMAPNIYQPKRVIMDPARTTDITKSDQSGYVVVSKIGTKIYVHESGGKYWQPDEIVSGAFDLSSRHDEAEVVIEKNSLDDWLLQPIRSRMLSTGVTLKLKPINAPQDRKKAQFVMGLQSFFAAGDIILVGGREAHPQLISQILNFPSGKKDVINALAYAPRVFSGQAVYGDFGEANIVHGYQVPRQASLLLALNASGTDTTAVLCALVGSYLTVLHDWISPLVPSEAVPDIAMFIRSTYPGRQVTPWVTADVFDQVGRTPLVAALKQQGWRASRGEYANVARGNLNTMIRTETRGRRLLQVDSNARHTLEALSLGYNYPIMPGGERHAEPENNSSKTLIIGLEILGFALTKAPDNDSLQVNSYNASGQPYLSALPR